MNYLVDTNILCEPQQKRPNPKVLAWLESNESSLYTSVLVVGEIRYGIELLPAAAPKRGQLSNWYDRLISILEGRVLSVNARVSEEWARMLGELARKQVVLPAIDSLIAATARRYQLTLVTANVADFRDAGVKIHNPLD